MKKISAFLNHLLNVVIALSLALMCIFVFGNVVLRYAFNSGITWSEEISRFLFVWLIFLGAIVALKQNEHLGVDTLVKRLPAAWQRICYVVSNVLVLFTLWLVFDGSLKLTMMNTNTLSPAVGMPYSYLYSIGMITSVGMALVVIFNLYRVIFRPDSLESLVLTKSSEEEILQPPVEPLQDKHQVTGGHR